MIEETGIDVYKRQIGSIVYMIVCLLNGLMRKQENTAIYYYLLIGTSLFFVIPFFLLWILPMLSLIHI